MSNLTRWNPNRDFVSVNEMMNRLFDQAFVLPQNGNRTPSVDVVENDDNIVVKAELPGFNPDNIDIRIEGNLLQLRGEYDQNNEKNEGQYHVREMQHASFNRTIPLPTTVDTNKANAEFENGVLVLTLPKHETAMPRKINITARSGSSLNPGSNASEGTNKNGTNNTVNQTSTATAGANGKR